MTSSSSLIHSSENDDVFLSFRGKDTRYNIITHLRKELRRNNIKFFIDDEIDRGDEITAALETAIEGAQISIIVFSPNYASSSACLHELVKIMECRMSKAQLVLPIFYKVEPSDATYQEALDEHKAKFNGKKGRIEKRMEGEMKKVEKWKSALVEAFELAGWHIKEESDEADIIEKVTKTILEKLKSSQSNGEKLMCTSIIGQTAKDIFKQVMKWLTNDNVSRVGIYGMGGVGKTTIATHINDELLDSNAFTHVCWVTVSQDMSIWKLQNEIAKTIKLDLSTEDDERKRAAKLRQRLKIEKFVLILDDVWKVFEIEEVGIPHLFGTQKLLLTSRNRRVCERMECLLIEVKPLSELDALDLFIKESKYEINDSIELKEIVPLIVRECAGLPLAIVVVARRMRRIVEIREWRNTLRELQRPCEGENEEMEEKVFKSLKFSYVRLPNAMFRQCFLYCSLFPEDYKFNRNYLISYWIGEGIINELDSKQAELDKGHCIINELVNASLLLEHNIYNDGQELFIKMHDVVRDMARIVIRENSKVQDGLKVQGLSEKTERCVNHESVLTLEDSMLERGVPNMPPHCSKLTTLSFNKLDVVRKLPSCFFVNIQNLAVLDMRSLYSLTSLPDSISNLGNLRVLLLLECVSLKDISSLARLKNLWDLDLSRTNLEDITEGMEKLINLRVLKLSWNAYRDAVFPGAFLGKLSHLQMLEIEKVEVEAEVLMSLKKLETLRITFNNLESLSSYFKSGHWKRLKEYFFVHYQKRVLSWKDLWEDDELKKVLHIESDYGGGKRETDLVIPNNIQKLLLEKWSGPLVDVVMNNTFDNLRQLYIKRCGGRGIIKHLFTLASAQRVLLNLEILDIVEIKDSLEEIISGEEDLVGEINNYYPAIHLPYLKSLRLRWLGNLKSIYKGRMVCLSLECIDIVHCEKLERLPFYMHEEQRNKHKSIQLEVSSMPNEWWYSLQWDDPNAKSMYCVPERLRSSIFADIGYPDFEVYGDDDGPQR